MLRRNLPLKNPGKPINYYKPVNKYIRNLVITRFLQNDDQFIKLQKQINIRYRYATSLCKHFNSFYHDPETYEVTRNWILNGIEKKSFNKSRSKTKIVKTFNWNKTEREKFEKLIEEDLAKSIPETWEFIPFGSVASGIVGDSNENDYDISFSPNIVENQSGSSFTEVHRAHGLIFQCLVNQDSNKMRGLLNDYREIMYHTMPINKWAYTRQQLDAFHESNRLKQEKNKIPLPRPANNQSTHPKFQSKYPIDLTSAKFIKPKPNLQVTMKYGYTNMNSKFNDLQKLEALFDEVRDGNPANHNQTPTTPGQHRKNLEIVCSRSRYNVINTEYLRIHATENLYIFKFLLILKYILKNTQFGNLHGLTSYAGNMLGIFYLQTMGYLPSLKELNLNSESISVLENTDSSPKSEIINQLLESKELVYDHSNSEILSLENWNLFPSIVNFETNYDKKKLESHLRQLRDPKKYPLVRDTKFLLVQFFQWFYTIFDEQAKAQSKTAKNRIKYLRNIENEPVLILDCYSNQVFNRYNDFLDYYVKTNGFIPNISSQRLDRNVIRDSCLVVVDPFERTHNIIRSDFDKKTAADFQSLISEILEVLTD